ncbi:MAG: hypothetical protein NG747_16265 [Candidatus Brocadia sp.]|nr:hypothetical protein [Candidatus Brocadia sp.]
MSFNELNTVDHFIIHRLTGVNLNAVQSGVVAEDPVEYDTVAWKYVQSELLQRNIEDVLLEKELTEALCRLNPEIAAQPERAEEVIHKLRSSILCAQCVFICNRRQRGIYRGSPHSFGILDALETGR